MLFSLLFRFAFYGLFKPFWRVFFRPCLFIGPIRIGYLSAADEAEKAVVGAFVPVMIAGHCFLPPFHQVHLQGVAVHQADQI
jgi:hypothetical protein